jgi:hypothetical protein
MKESLEDYTDNFKFFSKVINALNSLKSTYGFHNHFELLEKLIKLSQETIYPVIKDEVITMPSTFLPDTQDEPDPLEKLTDSEYVEAAIEAFENTTPTEATGVKDSKSLHEPLELKSPVVLSSAREDKTHKDIFSLKIDGAQDHKFVLISMGETTGRKKRTRDVEKVPPLEEVDHIKRARDEVYIHTQAMTESFKELSTSSFSSRLEDTRQKKLIKDDFAKTGFHK